MDCRPPGILWRVFSVRGILQATILEWAAMPSSRGSSKPRGHTCISTSPALASGFFTTSSIWEAQTESCLPFHVHTLIFRTCESITLRGRNNFADRIHSRILTWEASPGLWGGIHKDPQEREVRWSEAEKERWQRTGSGKAMWWRKLWDRDRGRDRKKQRQSGRPGT